MAPLRKPGDEGTAMLCRVIDGGILPEYPLMPLGVLVMLTAAERGTGTSELDWEGTCPSLDREAPCAYPDSIVTCLVVGVLLPKDIKTWFSYPSNKEKSLKIIKPQRIDLLKLHYVYCPISDHVMLPLRVISFNEKKIHVEKIEK